MAQGGVTDCSSLIDAPAGKHGFTRIEGQHFVNDAGRIRFNGVNMARLHYFDLVQYRFREIREKGILVDDGTLLTFDAEQQDKFDYLVYQLKKHGVYVNVNLLVGRRFKDRNGFDPDIQQKEIDYAQALFAHVNPYTCLSLVDDPAMALVELNNENAVVTSIIRYKKDLTVGENTPDWPTYRPVDRPYTVSEYNHPFPNLYGAEGQPMLHAYGAFQGWDGLIGHSYHNLSDVEPDHLAYNFTYAARTDALAHSIACATMFLRGDVLWGTYNPD